MSIFLKILIYITPMGLSCGSRDLFCIKQDLSSGPGGSGGCRLCLCSTWAYLLCCMWDLISPTKDWTSIESPLWQGRFLTWNSCDHQEYPMKNQYSEGVTCIRITNISLFTTIIFLQTTQFYPISVLHNRLVRPQRLSRLKESIRVSLHGEIKE